MPELHDKKKYFELANTANSTFGSSGPGHDPYKYQREQLRFKVLSDKQMQACYQAIVTFDDRKYWKNVSEEYIVDAQEMFKTGIERFIKDHKENTGKTVKLVLDQDTLQHSIELVSNQPYSRVRRGFVRVSAIVDVTGGETVSESKKTTTSLKKLVKEAVQETLKELHDDVDSVEMNATSFEHGLKVSPKSATKDDLGFGYVHGSLTTDNRGNPAALVFWPSIDSYGIWSIDDLNTHGSVKSDYKFPPLNEQSMLDRFESDLDREEMSFGIDFSDTLKGDKMFDDEEEDDDLLDEQLNKNNFLKKINIGDSVYVSGLTKPLKVISVSNDRVATLQGQRKTYTAIRNVHDELWRVNLTTFGPASFLTKDDDLLGEQAVLDRFESELDREEMSFGIDLDDKYSEEEIDFMEESTIKNFDGEDLRPMVGKEENFKGKDISDSSFKNANISHKDFSASICIDCDFTNTNAKNAFFTDAVLTGSSFDGSNLSGSKFKNTAAKNCSFSNADLTNVDFENAILVGCDFTNAKMHGVNLKNATFNKKDLMKADLDEDTREKVWEI